MKYTAASTLIPVVAKLSLDLTMHEPYHMASRIPAHRRSYTATSSKNIKDRRQVI